MDKQDNWFLLFLILNFVWITPQFKPYFYLVIILPRNLNGFFIICKVGPSWSNTESFFLRSQYHFPSHFAVIVTLWKISVRVRLLCPFTPYCIVSLLPLGLCNSSFWDCPLLFFPSGLFFQTLFIFTTFFWQLPLKVLIFPMNLYNSAITCYYWS